MLVHQRVYTFANFRRPKAITAVKSLGSARAMELFKDLEEPWLVPNGAGAGQDLDVLLKTIGKP